MNEEQRERGLKFRVGAFVLVSILVFLAVVYALGARARLFEPRYTIHADFTEVGGLTTGATVRLAGVQIGRVSEVNLPPQPGGKVRVDLSIARRFHDRIRRDSVARIETQGLLGDKIVEITVGSAVAPALEAGDLLRSQDPTDLNRMMSAGAETVKNIASLADALRTTADTLNQSTLIEDAAGAARAARRVADKVGRLADQVSEGRGWAHALLYEEPVALRRLGEAVASVQRVLDRIEGGQGAAGVLVSPDSTAAAKRFVAAMDRVGRLAEGRGEDGGVLTALLFDPRYRGVLDDLRVVARNFREVSDRVAGGQGMLGALVRDERDGGVERALDDLKIAVANLRAVSERVKEGEGTLGALLADPTLYERLVTVLEGAERSLLLRTLIRGLGRDQGRDDARR